MRSGEFGNGQRRTLSPLLLPLNFIPSTSRATLRQTEKFPQEVEDNERIGVMPDPLCQTTSSLGAQSKSTANIFCAFGLISAIAIRLLPLCLAEALPGWNDAEVE